MEKQVLPVENTALESVQDDAVQAQDNTSDISEIIGADAAAQAATPEAQPKEPGWIKQRVNDAVEKRLAQVISETEARIRAEYEAQMMPLRESIIEREANDLVDSGQIKERDMALAYARMKHGLSAQSAAPVNSTQEKAAIQAQPRDERGRFVPAQEEVSAEVKQRADLLAAQAKAITAAGGPDVMRAYREDENIRNRILSGEWDFSDVATSLRSSPSPTPVRAANGQEVSTGAIAGMTDEQFDALNAALRKGKRFKT